jgi:GT2 family glycosyltransferase
MSFSGLSIVIVTFNSWHHLDKCLRSIIVSGYPFLEIIVVDNASVDGTSEYLKSSYKEVRMIENPQNDGFIRAVNQGFRMAKGSRILLLDVDTELRPDAIEIMSAFMDDHPEASIVVPRILNSDGTVQYSVKNYPSFMNALFGRQSVLTGLFPDNPFARSYLMYHTINNLAPFTAEYASAACMMIRKSILSAVTGLDEGFSRFVGYWADADFCKRVQNEGGALYCVPKAVITHYEQNKPFRKKNPKRIIEFHAGAHRLYRLHFTYGKWDPRSVIAAILLFTRTLLLLIANSFKKASETQIDPLSQKK